MKISKNTITKEEYLIPDNLDDSYNINEFLASHDGKKVIAVQGLGFVGAVMSIVCANSDTDYVVIGVDLPNEENYWKIRSINEGIFPIIADDPKIDEYYKNSKNKNNFYATYDTIAYSHADIVIVDINLDVKKRSSIKRELNDFDVCLSGFKKAIKKDIKGINGFRGIFLILVYFLGVSFSNFVTSGTFLASFQTSESDSAS